MTNSRLFAWLKLMLATVLLPLLILGAGSYYLASLSSELRFREIENEAAETLETMRFTANTEKYLCSSITAIFYKYCDPKDLQAAVEKFSREHALPLRFLVWAPTGKVNFSNFDYQSWPGNFEEAYLQMKNFVEKGFGDSEKTIPADVTKNLRDVFGPHFFPRYYSICFESRYLKLIRADARQQRPLAWLGITPNVGLTVFFEYDVLQSYIGLKHMVKNNESRLTTGFINNSDVVCENAELSAAIPAHIEQLRHSYKNHLDLSGYYLFTNYIDEKTTGFCAIKKREVNSFNLSSPMLSVLLTLMLLPLIFAGISYRSIVNHSELSLRIRWQLLLLFLVANTLPGFVLLVVGSDYLQQYRASLLNSAYNQSMTYLQSVDELYSGELTVQKAHMNKGFVALKKALKKNKIDRKTIRGFLNRLEPKPYRFFLVASSTGVIASEKGILKDGKIREAFTQAFKKDSIRINTMDAAFKLGTFAMAYLNKKPVSTKIGTEVEFIADALMQKQPAEMIRVFFDAGKFFNWGLGTSKHPTYVDMFKLFDDNLYDYLFLYLWSDDNLELNFIRRVFHNINRNELGLNIMAVNERFTEGFPEEILQNQRLKDFSLKLRERAVNRPEFCVLDGVEYLLAGHKCILMSTIRLLALFPVARVDQQVASKKQLLTWLVLISLLISISLGLFVSGSILRPLGALQLGITALRERNFAYRLPDLGGDEFGHLASIFNDTLVDLEEMHVASIVQEKLMTQMAEPLSAGKLNFFGQTISLAGMGGDYFEVCETDQGTPSLVLGDVPERGAGTSLILAFVKSAIMQLHELSSEPEDFVAGLHDLILRSSREGQYKTFCLQYIVFGNGSELQIVNAGLPNPIIIDHRADVLTELRLQSLPAGSPENANWKSTCVKLEEGQSLVCFTGGILRNAAVNAEQIADLLRRTKSADPQTFSSHFLEEYFKLVSRGECADDVSLLIIHHTAA